MTNSPILSNQPGIDLHLHTTASDGSFSPTDIVRMAHNAGLIAISITDHDTLGAQEEGQAEAKRLGIRYIPGIELSTLDDGGKYDMLGYGIDLANKSIQSRLEDVRSSRANRNQLMMAKMAESGLKITWDDILAEVGPGGDVVGRPHMAAAMIKKGIVSSTQEAFDNYLAEGKPLYLPKDVLTSAEAVALIHDSGGVAVFAHPALSRWKTYDKLEAQLVHAKSYGLDGLEVYYSQHTDEQTQIYSEMADRLGLIKTGGSDFHGAPKPHIKVGVVIDGSPAPAWILESIG